jgi:hypothetical protein
VAAISRACRVLDAHGDDSEAQRVLLGIVDWATSRLEAIAAARHEQEAADAAELANRLSFDDSDGGERLRRLQMYHGRSFFRMLDILLKIRSSAAAHPGSLAAAPPELVRALSGAGDAGSMTTRRSALLEPSDRFVGVSLSDVPAPAGPVPLDTLPPLGLLAAVPVVEQDLGNEPGRTAGAPDEQDLRNEPSRDAQASDERNARNEPSRGVGERDEGREPPGGAGAACLGVVSGGGENSEGGGGFPGRPAGLAAPTAPDPLLEGRKGNGRATRFFLQKLIVSSSRPGGAGGRPTHRDSTARASRTLARAAGGGGSRCRPAGIPWVSRFSPSAHRGFVIDNGPLVFHS